MTRCSHCGDTFSLYAGVSPFPVFCSSKCRIEFTPSRKKPMPKSKYRFKVVCDDSKAEMEYENEQDLTASLKGFADAADAIGIPNAVTMAAYVLKDNPNFKVNIK